jgi:hypothetical protein
MKENDYTVIVKLGEEAIFLSAFSAEEALERARDIISEEYGWDLSRSVEYSIEARA